METATTAPAPRKELFSEALQTKYIKIGEGFLTDAGVYFTRAESKMHKADALRKIYLERLHSTKLYDYAYAVSTGILRAHKDQESVKAKAEKTLVPTKSKFDTVMFIRIASALIATIASVVLFSYTSEYFSKSNGPFRSNAFAAIILAFNILAVDISIYFFMMKKRLMAWSFIFLLAITVPFSMFATVDVSYTNYFNSQAQEINTKVEASADMLSVQKDAMKAKLEAMNAAIRVRDAAALDEKTPQWYLSQLSSAVSKATDDYNKTYADYMKTVEATPEAVSNSATKTLKKDLFNAIEDAWHIPRFKVYFVINTLPAVFLDVIASLMAAIALFLGGKKDERREGI